MSRDSILFKFWEANQPAENLLFKDAAWRQRDKFDKLGYMIGNITGQLPEISVIGKHMSKSVVFPVVEYKFSNGASIAVRDNLYNYSISVISPTDVPARLVDPLCKTDEKILSVYCEGFPEDRVYGPYTQDQKKFTFRTWEEESFSYFMIGFARLQKELMPARDPHKPQP